MNRIRPLTDVERKCFIKYRDRLVALETEASRIREFLNDMTVAFAGREGPVMINEMGLFERPEGDQ